MSEEAVQRLMGLADEFAEDAANDVQAFSTHASRKRLESALREVLAGEAEQPPAGLDAASPAQSETPAAGGAQ